MAEIDWTYVTEDGLEVSPTFGDYEGAEVAIELRTGDDGEQEIIVECLCAVCHEISQVGVLDAMDHDRTEPLADGVYFMEFWHEVTHHWEYGDEHDTGIRLHKKEN